MGYKIKPKYPLFLKGINKDNNNGGGYPIVTIEDNFNIEVKPNVFYDIKNGEDDEINISFVQEEFYNDTVVNEFIFNINSPANISFDKEIKWNNNKEPDLTQIGIYTISIFNSVGCYTFINTNYSMPNNEIWYTSNDGNIIVIPNTTDVFGINIVNNTYKDGKGIITFDGDVTSIGIRAFYECYSLTSVTIPNSVKSIGEYAFGNSNLSSIVIPNSVENIGYDAFYNCPSLTSINVDSNNPNYSSVDGVLFSKGETTLIKCPECKWGVYTIPNSVTSIEDRAFYWCRDLTSIAIPNSIISIGYETFLGCTSVTSITIPESVTSIGYKAFSDCHRLTSVTIPNSVTSIEDDAFNGILNIVYHGTATGSPWGAKSVNGYVENNLVYPDETKKVLLACFTYAQGEIIIPNGVTSIGNEAFYRCKSLTSIVIPNGVTSIGDWAFTFCSGLTSISYNGTISQWNAITKGTDWNTNVPATVVHCTNGDVEI